MQRSLHWLLLAAVFITLAVVLMREGGSHPTEPARTIEFPRHMRPHEAARARERRSSYRPRQPVPVVPTAPAPAPAQPRDPVLTAVAVKGESALVIEANALRHSWLGEVVLGCLQDESDGFERLTEDLGFDLREDLDRVAVAERVTVLSGHFGNAQWDELLGDTEPVPCGDEGRIYQGQGPGLVATWRDELVLVSRDRAAVEAAIDRMEGRGPPARPAIDSNHSWGELYGVLSGDDLAALLGQPLGSQMRAAAGRVEVHADARDGIALTAQVDGSDPEALADLAKALGAALSVARLEAGTRGDPLLADLLDHARVIPGERSFDVDVALPQQLLEARLSDCAWVPGRRP